MAFQVENRALNRVRATGVRACGAPRGTGATPGMSDCAPACDLRRLATTRGLSPFYG